MDEVGPWAARDTIETRTTGTEGNSNGSTVPGCSRAGHLVHRHQSDTCQIDKVCYCKREADPIHVLEASTVPLLSMEQKVDLLLASRGIWARTCCET